jgi:aminoglycoside phosphotransferase (APT) family kinase protein
LAADRVNRRAAGLSRRSRPDEGGDEEIATTVNIDASLVRRLIEAQFPEWAHLPIEPVASGGWDNRTFHLGAHMSVRLPSAAAYAPQVEKEHRWLPVLAAQLPLPIPAPLAMGAPTADYPWRWSVYRWLDGEPATRAPIADRCAFAIDLAKFLAALQRIDAADGPAAGVQNFHRGGPLATYDAETRAAIATLGRAVDADAASAVWAAGLSAPWLGAPVWLHGDVSAGNLLVRDGALGAVIDFGLSGVGDPACDLAIAWTFFKGESRRAFRANLPLDDGAWARGKGWALWKALITCAGAPGKNAPEIDAARRVMDEVLSDRAQRA